MYEPVQLQHGSGARHDLDTFLGIPQNEPTFSGGGPTSGMGTLLANTFRWLDFGLVVVPTRIKTLVVAITAALTVAVAQQNTIQLFVARSIYQTAGSTPQPNSPGVQASNPFTPVASAAASQFPTNPATNLNAGQLRGAPVSLGASSASLGPAVFFFTPQDIPDLQWDFPVVGVEITGPAAYTGGSVTVYLELANV